MSGIRPAVVCAVGTAWLSGVWLAAQGAPLPAAPPSTSVTVTGTVRDVASGRPIAGAVATLTSTTDRKHTQQAVSDEQGRVVWRSLRPGRFTVSGSKSGYYLARWAPGRASSVVYLASGRARSDVVVLLERQAVVSGTVRDATGKPLAGATVFVYACDGAVSCSVRRDPPIIGKTGVQGTYRLGVAAGAYVVAAEHRGQASTAADSVSLESARRRLADVEQTTATKASLPAPPPAVLSRFVTSYAPDVTDPTLASVIDLAPGSERAGIDVRMVRKDLSRVQGVVLDHTGRPLRATGLGLLLQQFPTNSPASMVAVAPDGSFVSDPLPPGPYRLGGRISDATGVQAWAFTDVVLDGIDLSGLVLRLRPTLTASGRVLGSAPGLTSAAGLRFEARRTDTTAVFILWDRATGMSDATGGFRIDGLAPGTYDITCRTPTGQPCPGELRRGAQALVNDALTVSTSITDLRLDLASGATELTGTVRRRDGSSASDYSVIVFPPHANAWKLGTSSRVRIASVSADGRYVVTGLPAGRYLAAPVGLPETVEPTPWLLQGLLPAAREITLQLEHRRHIQDLIVD